MAESFGALALARGAGRLEHAAGDAVAMAALPPLAALTIAAYRALLSSDGGDARSSASQDWRLR